MRYQIVQHKFLSLKQIERKIKIWKLTYNAYKQTSQCIFILVIDIRCQILCYLLFWNKASNRKGIADIVYY